MDELGSDAADNVTPGRSNVSASSWLGTPINRDRSPTKLFGPAGMGGSLSHSPGSIDSTSALIAGIAPVSVQWESRSK